MPSLSIEAEIEPASDAYIGRRGALNDDNQALLLSDTHSDRTLVQTDNEDDSTEGREAFSISDQKTTQLNEDAGKEEVHKPTISLNTTVATDVQKPNALPPKDGGFTAWRMLLACLVLESVTFGLPLSFGIFQEFYESNFPGNTIASWIGVLSNGVPFLGAPIVTYLCQKYTISRKWYILLGSVICLISLLLSAFIPVLTGLIITQGVLYGIGALLVDITLLIILNTWFDERRGLAYGLVFGGTDLFGVVYTFLTQVLLDKLGLKSAMLILAGMLVAIASPAIFFVRERPLRPAVPDASESKTPWLRRAPTMENLGLVSTSPIAPADVPFTPSTSHFKSCPTDEPTTRYYHQSLFYVFNLANFLHASAYYLPFIYLPSFVVALGHSKMTGATVLALANFAQVLGDVGFGKLSDKLHVTYLIILSTFVSSFATFVLWGVFGSGSQSLGILITYAIIFGSFGGGFLGTWARMGIFFGDRDAQNVYASLSFGRGAASILSGPLSQALVMASGISVFGGKYGDVIAFTGASMAGGGFMGIGAILVLWLKKEMGTGKTKKQEYQLLNGDHFDDAVRNADDACVNDAKMAEHK